MSLTAESTEPGAALLAAAERNGPLALPGLLAVELCALGAYRHGLFATEVLAAWADLDPRTRKAYGEAAIRGLARRGLLARRDPDGRSPAPAASDHEALIQAAPELAAILLARGDPTWIGVCVLEGTGIAGPRIYGLGDVNRPLRAAVVELPFGSDTSSGSGSLAGACHYLLASTSWAAAFIADWVLLPPSRHGEARAPAAGRAVDLYRRGTAAQPLARDRIRAGDYDHDCDHDHDHDYDCGGGRAALTARCEELIRSAVARTGPASGRRDGEDADPPVPVTALATDTDFATDTALATDKG
jgi:hypothetical protein